jgi:hypothetical protein
MIAPSMIALRHVDLSTPTSLTAYASRNTENRLNVKPSMKRVPMPSSRCAGCRREQLADGTAEISFSACTCGRPGSP